ncbi:hypothetical protein T492DRAFT_301128 [Pavlovales sp. CCMP2436]|nr:hypothetical protein T492DRAFT_301128 [Pavlovales sp. CCMP2436]
MWPRCASSCAEMTFSSAMCAAHVNCDQANWIPGKLLKGSPVNTYGTFSATQLLKNFRSSAKSHLLGPAHEWCVETEVRAREAKRAQLNLGLNLGRLAYTMILEADSHTRSERKVSHLQLMGLPVGDKNHDRKFVKEFTKCVEQIMRRAMLHFLGEQRPQTLHRPVFAVNADKLTCMRRTSQMVGGIMLVEGEIRSIFLGCFTCGVNLDGEHTAKNALGVLERMVGLSKVRLREQWVSFAADGAYFSTRVEVHLVRLVGVSLDWILAGWDNAHRLELVVNDIRKDTALILLWYRTIAEKLSSLQADYRYGKHYEEALDIAEAMKRELFAPTYICTTRFCSSERKVYVNFYGNWTLYHTNKEKRWEAETVAADRAGLAVQLKTMKGFLFMAGLIDLLEHVSKLSVFVQLVNSLPWEKIEANKRMLVTTARLRAQLAVNGTLTVVDFPNLQPRVCELLRGELHGIKLNFIGANTSNPKLALRLVFKRLVAWLVKFETGMQTRLVDDTPAAYAHMARALDLRRLARAALHNDAAEKAALCWLANWIREEGWINLPSDDELWAQHCQVRSRLVTRAAQLAGSSFEWFPSDRTCSGTVMMRVLFTDSCLYLGVHDWLFLFELCSTHTSNESVVESMGNIIDKHAAPGRHLAPVDYSREAYIHWNGSPLHPSNDLVNAALNLLFNALGPGDWNFLHKTLRPSKLKFRAVSQVVDRHRAERSKLPFMETQWQAPVAAGGFAADSDGEDGDAADATGVLDDDEEFGETGTHAELGTFEVETILKYRCNRMKRRDEWLVKWKNYPRSKNTWERFSHFMTSEFRDLAKDLKRRATGVPHIVDSDKDDK